MKERYQGDVEPTNRGSLLSAAKSFVETKLATRSNPEINGTAVAALAGCYMAFGSERCDLKKFGKDVLQARLMKYLIAYNDVVDVAEKIKDTDPEIYNMIVVHTHKCKKDLDNYFVNSNINGARASELPELKEYLQNSLTEIDSVEHEMFDVKPAVSEEVAKHEIERLKKGRELVNALEMLMNIRISVKPYPFEIGGSAEVKDSIAELAVKYSWLISENYDPAKLSEDQRRARMLFFGMQAFQIEMDVVDCAEDINYRVWKPTTYMVKIMGMPFAEMKKRAAVQQIRYAQLAEQNGMSRVTGAVMNLGTNMNRLKNFAIYKLPDFLGEMSAKIKAKEHLREKVTKMLQKKHPGKYRV